MPAFVLASSSTVRLHLLKEVGLIPDHICPAHLDESVLKRELPRIYVQRMSEQKADAVFKLNPDAVVLSADTIVTMGRRIFQKPACIDEARNFLELFSGRRQRVLSSVTVKSKKKLTTRVVSTTLNFKRLSQEDISQYLATKQWTQTSGGLCVEKFASKFIRAVNGSFSNIMGLPMLETCHLLSAHGVYSDIGRL